jgi:hypothetical protein
VKLKSLMLAAILSVVGAVEAHAAVETYEAPVTSCTVNQVSVSSSVTNSGGTALFSAALVGGTTTFQTLMDDRSHLFVQNTSTFATVACVVGLSSTSANGDLSLTQPAQLAVGLGFILPPTANGVMGAQPATLPNLAARNSAGRVLIPWCVNGGGTGVAKVNITQCKR